MKTLAGAANPRHRGLRRDLRIRGRTFGRRHLRAAQITVEDFLALAERAHGTVMHDGDLVRCSKNPHSVGNDYHRGICSLHLLNSVVQHAFSEVIETCVRFVENHETWRAKKSARKAQALAISARESRV